MLTKRQKISLRHYLFKESNIRPFLRLTKENTVKAVNTIYEAASFLQINAEEIWTALVEQKEIKGWMVTHVKHNDTEAVYAKLYWSTKRYPEDENKHICRNRPVKLMDIYTKKVTTFSTLTKAGDMLGIKASHVRTRISVPEKIRLLYGRYVVIDAVRDFDFLTDEALAKLYESIKWGIIVFDGRKKTIQQFSGLTAYMRLMGKMVMADNAMRLLRRDGIYQVDKYRFIMNASYSLNNKSENELIQLFIKKINTTYNFCYR